MVDTIYVSANRKVKNGLGFFISIIDMFRKSGVVELIDDGN